MHMYIADVIKVCVLPKTGKSVVQLCTFEYACSMLLFIIEQMCISALSKLMYCNETDR